MIYFILYMIIGLAFTLFLYTRNHKEHIPDRAYVITVFVWPYTLYFFILSSLYWEGDDQEPPHYDKGGH